MLQAMDENSGQEPTQTAASEWRRYWYLPLAAALGSSTTVLYAYAIGSFVVPLQKEFDWSRAHIFIGMTCIGVASIIFSTFIGSIVDRIGPRRIGLAGVLLMAAAFALLGTATGSVSNWLVLSVIIAFSALWLQNTVWISAVASRFDVSRGLSFAVSISGSSLGATIFPLLSTRLIDVYGWRTAFFAMGGIWAMVVFPILLIFFRGARDGPRKNAIMPKTSESVDGMSLAEAIKSPAFYKLLIASSLFTFTCLGMVVHFVPILINEGVSPNSSAKIASLIGIFSLLGRLVTGALIDRLPGHLVGAGVFPLPIISCALLLLNGASPFNQIAAAAFLGLTVGAEVDVVFYLTSRYFGLKSYGTMLGMMTSAFSLGMAAGPLAAGTIYDRWNSYSGFLWLVIVLIGISSIALASLGAPRFGYAHSPIRKTLK